MIADCLLSDKFGKEVRLLKGLPLFDEILTDIKMLATC